MRKEPIKMTQYCSKMAAESPDLGSFTNSPEDLYQQFIELHMQQQQNQQQERQKYLKNRTIPRTVVGSDGLISSDGVDLVCEGDDQDQDHLHAQDSAALDVANEFECLTDAHLTVLMNLKAKRSLTEEDSKICKKLEVMLKEERNTWRLAKALFKDQLLAGARAAATANLTQNSDRMDDSTGNEANHNGTNQNNTSHDGPNDQTLVMNKCFSEEQNIGNYFVANDEVRRMQLVTDWLEANEANDLDYKDEEDKVEFYSEGPTAWENTFHAIRASYNIHIPNLDITVHPNAGLELCHNMDPDAPIRTKKALVHSDKEVEIRLFKHLFRFIRAGKLDEGQVLAQRVGYHWLSAILDGWLPFSDPNLDEENLGNANIHQPSEIKSISGNKKRDVWKRTCFKSAKLHGLNSSEKAILGVLGGNLKSVLPVCNSWSDQLWARLKCSIDVKIERALRDPRIANVDEGKQLVDFPEEFYANYQSIPDIFKSMKDLQIVSSFKEATIHQTVQKFFILNDIDGLLDQLSSWCSSLDYDNNLADNNDAISPQFLRFFAHIVLFLRDLNLVTASDSRGTKIIESYINLLTQQRSIESVAHYTVFLPRENQIVSFAKLLATIDDKEERRQCLKVAKMSRLDVDDITQTVVELIRDETSGLDQSASMTGLGLNHNMSTTNDLASTKTTSSDRRKIDALDYLLLLESKNYVAILHHGNILLRRFALKRKIDAVKETFLKLPSNLTESVENQWRVHTNTDITISLRNNLRELESFRALLEAQEELFQWSEWHHKKPEEPKKPANLSKFCDNVNYEQRLKQYQQDLNFWRGLREARTDALINKITQMFYFPGGWMQDLTSENDEPCQLGADVNLRRLDELKQMRKYFIPHMITICFNVLHLTQRYEDYLKVTHLIAQEDTKLYEEFTKVQIREILDKISEVTKIIVKKSLAEESEDGQQQQQPQQQQQQQ